MELIELTPPSWLSESVVNELNERIEFIKSIEGRDDLDDFATYNGYVKYFNRLIPVFTEPSMKNMWLYLNEKSPLIAQNFAWHLMAIEYHAQMHFKMQNRSKESQQEHFKIVKNAKKLLSQINEYKEAFNSGLSSKELVIFADTLSDFIDKEKDKNLITKNKISNIKWLNSECIILSRELNSPNTLPLIFLKMISLFFRRKLGKPLQTDIETYEYKGEK